MKKQFRSRLLASVHETAEGLHEVRVIKIRYTVLFCLVSVRDFCKFDALPSVGTFYMQSCRRGYFVLTDMLAQGF